MQGIDWSRNAPETWNIKKMGYSMHLIDLIFVFV